MSATIHDLADRVLDDRAAAWDAAGGPTAIAAAGALGPDDEAAVRRVVAAAGYAGAELEAVARQVSERVVGKVIALRDQVPADYGD